MVVYVSHKGGCTENVEQAKKIVHDLQTQDTENCYLCPLLAFSAFETGEVGYVAELDIRKDAMSICDKLLVASDVSDSVEEEIAFAELIGMPIEWLLDRCE